MFSPTSRYYYTPQAKLDTASGEQIAYLRRRFVPAAERFQLLQLHTVTEKDRLDNIAAQYLGDPEQFWRICDANSVLDPHELTDTVGRKIRITLPEGIPAQRNA
ncbi:MAG TPA: LysM domain-containing protein [Thermoanaerobaculia bacterium]|jgi:hypothetical protein